MWTSSVCFLCLKAFNCNEGTPGENLRLKFKAINNNRLALFFERFLKLPTTESPLISILCSKRQQKQSSSPASSSFLDEFCSECFEILGGTFQLYNELCEVQLKMAWRLGQLEAAIKEDETSKTSSKLSSLLQQKLSKQLQKNLGIGIIGGSEEVRTMRNLLLSHCRKARDQMLDHRKLEVALDRCSPPFPLVTQAKTFSNDDDEVFVKREFDDPEFDCAGADVEDSSAMDFEDNDFSNANPKQELTPGSSSSEALQPENVAMARLRRSIKNNGISYFRKPPAKNVKIDKPKVKKEKVIVNNSESGIACQVCGKANANLKKLRLHLQNHLDGQFKSRKRPPPTFQCRFCRKSFIFEQQRWIHEQIGTHDRNMTSMKFSCYEEVCNGNPPFTSFNDLEAHFESVHQTKNESVHKCHICQWPFTSDDMRQIHQLTHEHYPKTDGNQTKTFKCPKCLRQDFSNFSALQTHFISEHTNIEDVRIFKCHKCPTSYSHAISLDNHLKTHEMEEETVAGSSDTSRYHVCEECGKRCATSRTLAEHKTQAHRKVQCTLCGKLIRPTYLSTHMKYAHKLGYAPQDSCPICHKLFLGKDKVKRHMEDIHHQEKVTGVAGDVCHICSKKYQRRGLLQRHLQIAHQIEASELKRPAKFICPECGMGYYYKSSLDQHVDAKHRSSEERKHNFPCTLCSKTFWRKCVLTKHLKEAHGHDQNEKRVQLEGHDGLQ